MVDMANIPGEVLPEGATHRFYVMIDASAYMVTRYPDETYKVEPHDQNDRQRAERELREAVLGAAIWHLTGEGAGYHLGDGDEARAAAIKELLEDGPEGAEPEARDEADPIPHPVIREREPNPFLSLAGVEGKAGPHALRQWVVEIGPYNRCEVVFFGYDAENGSPELITQEVEEEYDYDEETE
jgi:hypothetical protein